MNTEPLLTNVDTLLNNVFWFEQNLEHPIGKSHRGAAITYVDIQERRNDFLRELKNTICNWVYSKSKYKDLFTKELQKRALDPQNASAHIDYLAKSKFRKGCPQGQFGELLLFNFIQFFFKAPPLLRKMSITTSVGHERFGADAIHYKYENNQNIFFLGESKAYKSKYKFNTALEESVSSIIKSYDTLQDELLLYVYDDFIEPDLQDIADRFKDGVLENTKIELACLISYHENTQITQTDETHIKNQIKKIVLDRLGDSDISFFSKQNQTIVKRIHYVVFPFWNFDDLLQEFDK